MQSILDCKGKASAMLDGSDGGVKRWTTGAANLLVAKENERRRFRERSNEGETHVSISGTYLFRWRWRPPRLLVPLWLARRRRQRNPRRKSWPQRSVRFVLPFGAGTATDVAARLMSEKLVDALGPADRDREPARRRRAARHQRLHLRQRRPRAALRLDGVVHGASLHARQDALQSRARFRADRARHRHDPGGQRAVVA